MIKIPDYAVKRELILTNLQTLKGTNSAQMQQ